MSVRAAEDRGTEGQEEGSRESWKLEWILRRNAERKRRSIELQAWELAFGERVATV